MLVIRNANRVPHGGWKWMDDETNMFLRDTHLPNLLKKASAFILANGRTFDNAKFIESVCKHTPDACTDQDPNGPTMGQMAVNFVSSMAQWLGAGANVAPKDMIYRRHEICIGCPHWSGLKDSSASIMTGRCKMCGCNGVKLALETSRCPLAKW